MNPSTLRTVFLAAIMFVGLGVVALNGQDAGHPRNQNKAEEVRIEDDWTQLYVESAGARFSSLEIQRELYYERGPRKAPYRPHVWRITKKYIEDGRDTKESPIVKHKFQRDISGKTGTIDLILVEADAKKNEEKRKLGVYYQIDDFLMICWNPPGEPRPESLMTRPKSKTTMVILRRGILK